MSPSQTFIMEPLEYLHHQMRLEGIGLDQDNRMVALFPGQAGVPLALMARFTNGSSIAFFDKAFPFEPGQALQGSAQDPNAIDEDYFIKTCQAFGLQMKVEHFRTYLFPEWYSQAGASTARTFAKDDPKVIAFGFDGFADQVYAVEEGGVIISACVSSRQNSESAEAWVMTAPDYRRSGLAQQVVRAWARDMLGHGMIPFYSHKLENLASEKLANRLGLVPVYEEIVVSTDQPVWNQIYQKERRVFLEPFERFSELVASFQQHGCQAVLDLGCGSGRHLVALARQGFQPFGLDNAPAGLNLARQWLDQEHLSAPLVLADMRQPLPFGDETFDGLLSTQVIHHAVLAIVIGTAREIDRVLKPGGVLFVTVPVGKKSAGRSTEIEPNTFVPLTGPEVGLPHHIFKPGELQELFPRFQVLDLSIRGGKVIALLALKQADSTHSLQSGLE
jgi:tellurite methyltransferase